MKNILTSMISGAIGAGLISAFFPSSFATNSSESLNEKLTTGTCKVEVSYPQMSVGDRCYENKVVVGLWNGNLYCARINVVCE